MPYPLTLVTANHCHAHADYLDHVVACVAAGCAAVQLRDKSCDLSTLLPFGRALQQRLTPLRTPLLINDHVDICLALDAAGVHLGQHDGNVRAARERLGPNKVIGLSVNTLQQLQQANQLPLDYVGIGAIFPTSNKPDVETVWGLDALRQACALSRHPVIAIGGIDQHQVAAVMACGVAGVAAIGAFHHPHNPLDRARQFIHTAQESTDAD